MSNELELEVFKTGDYGAKGTWGEKDLDGIAADYNPALHEAPVTIDHAQRGPALGWVESLRRVGDRLVARLRGMNERLMELIRTGAFKKRSVEIYPALKESGRPYLRAVSFLGAAAPEVKGLADPIVPEANAPPLFDDSMAGHIDFEMEEEPKRIDNDKDNENSNDNEIKNERKGANIVEFSELTQKLQTAGKWRPAWNERGIAEFYNALAAIDEINLNENETVNAAEWFARFLDDLPPVVTMGESAPARGTGADSMRPHLDIPRGPNVDPNSIALHGKVIAFMEETPGITYGDALRHCVNHLFSLSKS